MDIAHDGAVAWPQSDAAHAARRLEEEGFAVLAAALSAERVPVDELATLLVAAAGALFPVWLAEAEGIVSPAGVGIPAVRSLARRAAADAGLFGPFIEAVAEAALREGRNARIDGFSNRTVVREGAKLLALAYPGRPLAVVLEVTDEGVGGEAAEADLAVAAHVGAFALVLVGRGAGSLRRIRIAREARHSGDTPEAPAAAPYLTPLSGRPSPMSEAELRLEAFLARCPWAADRRWNHVVETGPLEESFRVDLLWKIQGCIVEIDGPEHGARANYAQDRRRDRRLQRMGYAVLRFTNEEVLGDVQRTASEIEAFLETRRTQPQR